MSLQNTSTFQARFVVLNRANLFKCVDTLEPIIMILIRVNNPLFIQKKEYLVNAARDFGLLLHSWMIVCDSSGLSVGAMSLTANWTSSFVGPSKRTYLQINRI